MDLPEEITTTIFSYLDHDSMKSATQVCKSWRSTIYGTMELMKKSKLLVRDFRQQKKFMKDYGKCFKTVCLLQRVGTNPSCTRAELVKILGEIANVTKLELVGGNFKYRKHDITEIPLPNLRELTLQNSANSFRISQFLHHVNLRELTLKIDKNGKYLDAEFMEWFWKQDHLQSLILQQKALKIFFDTIPIDTMQIRLNKLRIHQGDFSFPTTKLGFFEMNFIDFCKTQDQLEEVYFEQSSCMRPRPWRGVYSHLLSSSSIKKIQIVDHGLPQISVDENLSLESLIVLNPSHYGWLFVQIPYWQTLNKFKNLKHVEIAGVFELKNFLINCSKLKHLATLKLIKKYDFRHESHAFSAMQLPNLREINLTNILVNNGDWTVITANCPLIEKVTLDRFFLESNSMKLMCEEWKNLKELDLGCGVYTSSVFKVLSKSGSLQHFKITPIMKRHLDRTPMNENSFAVTVKKSIIAEEGENCPYSVFARNNRIILSTLMFLNNFRDFVRLQGV